MHKPDNLYPLSASSKLATLLEIWQIAYAAEQNNIFVEDHCCGCNIRHLNDNGAVEPKIIFQPGLFDEPKRQRMTTPDKGSLICSTTSNFKDLSRAPVAFG